MDKDRMLDYLMEENKWLRDRYSREKTQHVADLKAAHEEEVTKLKTEIDRLQRYVTIAKARKNRNTIRKKVLIRDNDECVKCGSEDFLQVDHIIALEKGGENTVENCQTLCIDCHIKKHEGESVHSLLIAQKRRLLKGEKS